MDQAQRNYAAARAAEEAESALGAIDSAERRVHVCMAQEYRRRAAGGYTRTIDEVAIIGAPAARVCQTG